MLNRTMAVASPCVGSPTISGVTSTIRIETCAGGGTFRDGAVTLSGSLKPGQSLWWEVARDAAGTDWQFLANSQDVNVSDQVVTDEDPAAWGSDGLLGGATFYARHRVKVVAGSKDCTAFSTSTQDSDDTMLGCA